MSRVVKRERKRGEISQRTLSDMGIPQIWSFISTGLEETLEAFPEKREEAAAGLKGVAAATEAAAEEDRFHAALKTEPGGK